MTRKKVLLSSIVTMFLFSGCLSSNPNPTTDKERSKTEIEKSANVQEEADKDIIDNGVPEEEDEEMPPESELKDEVIEEEVIIEDDGSEPQVIESVD